MPRVSAESIAPAISLSEEAGVRYLHFGSPWVQGAMRLSKPTALEVEYQRHMMAWLLFLQAPERLLQLGLGAGALTKFALKHFPQTRVQVAEISREVAACCAHSFKVPLEHSRLELYIQDAWAHLRKQSPEAFPVIQIDLYDWTANGPVYESEAFYRDAYRALASPGVLVVNLFGEHASFGRNLRNIDKVFDGQTLCLGAQEAANVVVLAFKGPAFTIDRSAMLPRAKFLSESLELPAHGWLATMPKQLGPIRRSRRT